MCFVNLTLLGQEPEKKKLKQTETRKSVVRHPVYLYFICVNGVNIARQLKERINPKRNDVWFLF